MTVIWLKKPKSFDESVGNNNQNISESFKVKKSKLNKEEKALKADRIAKRSHKKAKEIIRGFTEALSAESPENVQWNVDDFDDVPFELKSGFFKGEDAGSGSFTVASVKRNPETLLVEAVYIYASAITRVSSAKATETFVHEFFHTTKPGTVLYSSYRNELRPYLTDNGHKLPSYRNRPHEHWAFAITAEAMKHY